MSEAAITPLRVCYFGTYRANYNRNQIMIGGLRLAGVEVVECHATLWRGIEDRSWAATGGWISPAFWVRLAKVYFRLLRRYRQAGEYDVLVVGYPGILDVFLARLLANLRHKPLVWDVFMSVYLVALERGLDAHSRISIALLRWLESLALRIPDLLIRRIGLDEQEVLPDGPGKQLGLLRNEPNLPAKRIIPDLGCGVAIKIDLPADRPV